MAMANPPPGAFALDDGADPFVSGSQEGQRQRYSAFDNSQFSLYLNGSPAQARKALQAHLSETTRRLQETSHLGNALVQQRKELEEKLKEVDTQQEDSDIGPELRQRLAELEKEFNEVGRETARAFLPKSRVPSGETDSNAGTSVFSSEAHHSPSKVSVPSRKQRNQQPSRINDIALATEISTSLLSQLKELQAVLLEKDDALKAANLDRTQLEVEVEGLSQRLRIIDESESRLKDVNWGLETQVRELEASTKTATDKEHRLNQNLDQAKSEKASLEREFEELKQLYSKLNEDHTASAKHHDTEVSGLRRNVAMAETERGALQRKIDELASQNQELAKAVAYRVRAEEHGVVDDASPDDGPEDGDTLTPEHSPPPSPSKGTPRHGQLESETLKHSLHHAHRMIQQLKNNIHREKTEKIELKRMLQDARDELETNRNGANGLSSAGKKKKNDKDIFKKPARPDRLGALRTGSQEIVVDDEEWEEHDGEKTPSKRPKAAVAVPGGWESSAAETSNEGFETAEETGDAFETANERDGTSTETDAFQTGAETLDGDSSDDLTETEAGTSKETLRGRRPSPLNMPGNRLSYQSTASTSGDEEDDLSTKTPIQTQHPRYRLKLRQSAYRRSTPRADAEAFSNTPLAAKDSPASFVSSNNSTPAQGKSLFAELGDLSGGEDEDGSIGEGTPSRSSMLAPDSPPEIFRRSAVGKSPLQNVAAPRPEMVDSGMMTDPWTPPQPTVTVAESTDKDIPQERSVAHIGVATDPETPKRIDFSSFATQATEPVSPTVREIHPPTLNLSSLATQDTEPMSPVLKEVPVPPMLLSSIATQATEPVEVSRSISVAEKPQLTPSQVSALFSQATEPLEPALPASSQLSNIAVQQTSPVELPKPIAPQISRFAMQQTEPVELPKPVAPQISRFAVQQTEPIEPSRSVPRSENRFSDVMVLQHTQPESPTLPAFLPSPSRPSTAHRSPEINLTYSKILSQEVEPQEASRPATAHRAMPMAATTTTSEAQTEAPTTKQGFLSSMLPWNKQTSPSDENQERPPTAHKDNRTPLAPIAGNTVQSDRGIDNVPFTSSNAPRKATINEGTQTMVSAEQIDKILSARNQRHSGVLAAATIDKPKSPPSSPRRGSLTDVNRAPRRPSSSGSIRSREIAHPPLPPDYSERIEAASLKSPPLPLTPATPGAMGPPTMPASAYKKQRPQTPTVKTNVPSPKSGTTPRPRYQPRADTRSGAASPISRRSSISSFSSEMDYRFNMARAPFTQAELDPNTTDPRMIQAITQTMIGEYLWKYTRKAGRGEMSGNRHRRFFWVHPYTRTLYWSDKDPATAGRAELKAKSVAIQSVQVVTDDNPNPPGLHRKSLIVHTPGRTIKFTATTSQRHETWFNALSYLLMRSEDEQKDQVEDAMIQEFNPSHRSSSRQTGRSRASFASYASRRTSSPHHAQIPSLRHSSTSQQRASSQNINQGSVSGRLSSLSAPFRASFASRKSRASAMDLAAQTNPTGQVPQDDDDMAQRVANSLAHDPKMLEMENVRECCNGQHNVGSLNHRHSHSHSQRDRFSLTGSMSSRSHSRTDSYGQNSRHQHQDELEAANSGAGF